MAIYTKRPFNRTYVGTGLPYSVMEITYRVCGFPSMQIQYIVNLVNIGPAVLEI